MIRGEGIQGLTGPLLEAGARSILATGWDIEDRSGHRFVSDFYRALARRETVGESLRSAKLAAIDRGEDVSHWAAFTLLGDPDVRVDLTEPTPGLLLPVGLAVALLIALSLAVPGLRRRRTAERLTR